MRSALAVLAASIGAFCATLPAAAADTAAEEAAEAVATAAETPIQPEPAADSGAILVTPETAAVADWVIASGDNRSLPFAIIDKVAAEVLVFSPDGELLGKAPVLIGLSRGDDSAPGVGDKKLSAITAEEKTTPAGRFLAAYGPAPGGRKVLWVDYATAISLHPVVTNNPKEQRTRRIKSPSPEDNRITYGCINVPAAFYQKVVQPAFKGDGGVVYVLPEAKPLEQVFPAIGFFHTANSATEHQTSASAGPPRATLAE
ncbi:MAG: L,D-transpeptidase [Phenylobacterium sp.]